MYLLKEILIICLLSTLQLNIISKLFFALRNSLLYDWFMIVSDLNLPKKYFNTVWKKLIIGNKVYALISISSIIIIIRFCFLPVHDFDRTTVFDTFCKLNSLVAWHVKASPFLNQASRIVRTLSMTNKSRIVCVVD